MKIYTKTGDDGTTGLFGGARVLKCDPRVDAYGQIDELNSLIGLARAGSEEDDVDALLAEVQSTLFDVGSELAAVPGKEEKLSLPRIGEAAVQGLEQEIDRHEATLDPLRTFVLPGGTERAARMHVARTACRRAERQVIGLAREEAVRPILIRYLNRLSDLLFVLARVANRRAGVSDVPWIGRER